MNTAFELTANLLDIDSRTIVSSKITVSGNKIIGIIPINAPSKYFAMPGFIDAHVHIESSMLVPCEFARLAAPHGTVATVSDPHEIGNVLGVAGVEYMLDDAAGVPFKFYFGAPSCVPATSFETAGAVITASDIRYLFEKKGIKYLAEMMNWPGVLYNDPEVYEKITLAKELGKPIDGHAPGLIGEQAKKYIAAGISTDHECFGEEEALGKLAEGMKIIIREGSAAKNFEALWRLLHDHSDNMMFCSDDKHPDNLLVGHINELAKRAVAKGVDVFKVLKAACINPVKHYGLEVGLLKIGDPADFILVEDLQNFKVFQTYIEGRLVAENGQPLFDAPKAKILNNFNIGPVKESDFKLKALTGQVQAIQAFDGELITKKSVEKVKIDGGGFAVSDTKNDLLKFSVVNRYSQERPAIAFIKNFGLKEGAIASSVGHDSHNILVIGTDDRYIAEAVNLIVEAKGGVSAVAANCKKCLPLPVAGLMSNEKGEKVAADYTEIDRMAKEMGTKLNSPFMSLSFMALLVIPSLKLSDKGLFDGESFRFTELFV